MFDDHDIDVSDFLKIMPKLHLISNMAEVINKEQQLTVFFRVSRYVSVDLVNRLTDTCGCLDEFHLNGEQQGRNYEIGDHFFGRNFNSPNFSIVVLPFLHPPADKQLLDGVLYFALYIWHSKDGRPKSGLEKISKG